MGTTRKDISNWLENGKEKNITHMIVVCDTFDYEDYPVYVSKNQNATEEYSKINGVNMQKVMEVYSYNRDLEDQLNEGRVFHFD
ncbi:hypothetical protein HN903_00645 [archaeon]|jgi:hypothetical protein|nr:hypothetical protein [archaeon]MBT7128242.1 hypothetical protein [archaeon]